MLKSIIYMALAFNYGAWSQYEGLGPVRMSLMCSSGCPAARQARVTFRTSRWARRAATTKALPILAGPYQQARRTGLEPATTGSTVQDSNQLSYRPKSTESGFPTTQPGRAVYPTRSACVKNSDGADPSISVRLWRTAGSADDVPPPCRAYHPVADVSWLSS